MSPLTTGVLASSRFWLGTQILHVAVPTSTTIDRYLMYVKQIYSERNVAGLVLLFLSAVCLRTCTGIILCTANVLRGFKTQHAKDAVSCDAGMASD